MSGVLTSEQREYVRRARSAKRREELRKLGHLPRLRGEKLQVNGRLIEETVLAVRAGRGPTALDPVASGELALSLVLDHVEPMALENGENDGCTEAARASRTHWAWCTKCRPSTRAGRSQGRRGA